MKLRRRGCALAALLLLLPTCCLAEADLVDPRLKVAFVYNFLKFTEWPAQSSASPITLCIVNADDPLEAAFAAVNGRPANGHPVVVHSLTVSSDFSACNVVYLNDGAPKKLLGQFGAAQDRLLTISDAQNFVEAGGIIGLVVRDGKLQFEINVEASRHANYLLSAQLLKLAHNTQ